ncbi:hypothetical protein PSN45_004866 [Yamadazyma tenuis]|uniref:GroES-like protein n=1 Tax=Candida tenuis (strain ATCC 10573 / BCRC 21748 / CBS 615 / JCM 9827 / NBRC 10315 / NRRL Y-1498 / VKM Y-70) TaxID=590646 RepID=G3B1X5_CANTC|nr:GroES-like protein [Yamadazyma tenuis ATCC 10573]EGV64553.1 GroES-like protein [Yamadazyma tenuis ATCC 10573]WEJ97316.1 hypothetical protein PSN45_004866 [Yamadazyma tenuis]
MTIEQTAVLIQDVKSPLILKSVGVPEIGPKEILVQNKAIGLNPIDWKSKKYNFAIHSLPWINGRESSGIVVKTGVDVKEIKEGDNVILVSTSYRDLRTSTFQNYSVIDYRLAIKLPSFLSFEEGATIGVGLITSAIVFYDSFKVDFNSTFQDKAILIWGASTVVGLYLIQIAKIHGLRVLGVASSGYEEYLKERGVDVFVDKDNALDNIKTEARKEQILFAVDCVGEQTSYSVLQILENHRHSKFVGIVKTPKVQTHVEVNPVSIKRFHEDVPFGSRLIEIISKYLNYKQVNPTKVKVFNGLDSIPEALTRLEKEGAKAEKYVISIV